MQLHRYRKPLQGTSPRQILLYLGLLILWTLILTVIPADAEVVVSESEIHEAVSRFATDQVVGFDGDPEVTVRWRGNIRIPGTGAVRVEVQRSASNGSSRLIPVTLQLSRGPAIIREVAITAQVRYFADVPVAARSISRGEKLDGDAVAVERRDVTKLLGKYVAGPEDLAGKQARMRIGFGRPILDRYVELTPLIQRGDQVRIRVKIGGVTATSTGIAKERGALGESIMVETPENRQKLLARVAAPGIVDLVY